MINYTLMGTAFNRENEIAYSMRSLLEQKNCDDVEFIVIDDGSDDNTWEAIDREVANDERFELVRIEPEYKIAHFCDMWELLIEEDESIKDHLLYAKAMERVEEFHTDGRCMAVTDGWPLNIGFSICKGKIVIKTHFDLYLDSSSNLKETFEKYAELPEPFLAMQYFNGSDMGRESGPLPWHGSYATTRDVFWRIGGYEERNLARAWNPNSFFERTGIDPLKYSEFGLRFGCARGLMMNDWGNEGKDATALRDELMDKQQKDLWFRPGFDYEEPTPIFKQWLLKDGSYDTMTRNWKQCVNRNKEKFPNIPLSEFNCEPYWEKDEKLYSSFSDV